MRNTMKQLLTITLILGVIMSVGMASTASAQTSYPGYTGVYPGFTLKIDERFDAFNSSIWATGDCGFGENNARFHADGVQFSGGTMKLVVKPQFVAGSTCSAGYWVGDKNYIAGELRTNARYSYGRFEARLKTPASNVASGYIASLFTYANDPSAYSWREIDIEMEGRTPTQFQSNLIYGEGTYNWDVTRQWGAYESRPLHEIGATSDWKVYAIEWVPDAIRWYVDGVRVRELTESWLANPANWTSGQTKAAHIPNIAQQIMMNFWIPNDAVAPNFGGVTSGNVYPMTTEYDWFRYYEYTGTVVTPTPTPQAGQTAYNNWPAAIPGRVDVENYDVGGEGVAYHDTDTANNGGQYRTDAVDIQASSVGGYNVGWTYNGEWLEYTTNVTAGTYTINAQVSSPNSGRQIVVKLDNSTIGTINVPNTGDWQNWQTVSLTNVALAGGNGKILRLEFVGDGQNFNWIEFVGNGNPPTPTPTPIPTQTSTPTPTPTPQSGQAAYNNWPAAIPGRVDVENYDVGGEGVAYHDTDTANNGGAYRTDAVDIETCSEGWNNVGWINGGEWMEYTTNVTAGTYAINARVASPNGGGQIVVKLDNSTLGTINVPNTGGWQNWQTVSLRNIAVSGGNGKILRLEFVGGGHNFNWIEFVSSSAKVSQLRSVSVSSEQTPGSGLTPVAGESTLNEPSAVPEPGTFFLLGAGLLSLLALGRRGMPGRR